MSLSQSKYTLNFSLFILLYFAPLYRHLQATFVYFICNAIWLVATFFLQEIGGAVSIPIPRLYPNGTVDPDAQIFIDPIGLMFVIGFAFLLVIQFFAMLWHR